MQGLVLWDVKFESAISLSSIFYYNSNIATHKKIFQILLKMITAYQTTITYHTITNICK